MSDDKSSKKPQTIRETDSEAIRLGKTLISTARFAALAAHGEGEDAHPTLTRVQISTDFDGAPIILASALSPHFKAMRERPNVSLLVGEPAKGDPLAYARMTVQATAGMIQPGSDTHTHLRNRHLMRHPKAKLYVDFPDFAFFKLTPRHASLNGGFGKAFELTADDLMITTNLPDMAEAEPSVLSHMNDDHPATVSLYVQAFTRMKGDDWYMFAMDEEGFLCSRGDDIVRIWFDTPLKSTAVIGKVLKELADEARKKLAQAEA